MSLRHHTNNLDPPMGNSVVNEPGITRDGVSREDQDVEEHQSFPMDTNSQSRESRSLGPFKKFGVVVFNYSMSNPGEQFQLGDHLAQ